MPKGQKGKTVVFSIPDLSFEGTKLTWGTFCFYTPVGSRVDEGGHTYFEIQGDEIAIVRDADLYQEIFVYVNNGELEAVGYYEGEAVELPRFDLGGDLLFTVKIPPATSPEQEITIIQREVTDG